MKKIAFALVVLLHFCYSAGDLNLNKEIGARLEMLHNLTMQRKLNITPPDKPEKVPEKCQNKKSTVDEFARRLELLLNRTWVHENNRTVIDLLRINLTELKSLPQQQNDCVCAMGSTKRALSPFRPYRNFLWCLNRRK